MTDPILPRAIDILGAGHEALIAARPAVKQHLVTGRWEDVLRGLKAQSAVTIARLADEVRGARLSTAQGRQLVDLIRSEFDAVIDDQPQKAVGEVVLRRVKASASEFRAGLIRQGTRFRRAANATAIPARKEAWYESTEPVFCSAVPTGGTGDGMWEQLVPVPIRAVQAGAHANTPWPFPDVEPMGFRLVDQLFDAFEIDEDANNEAAGGSDGLSRGKLLSLAQGLAIGQYGATIGAIYAGLLLTAGISHTAVRERSSDGAMVAYIADDSWAYSDRLAARAKQNLNDKWLGFGCKCEIGRVRNLPVSCTAKVRLKDRRHLADTAEIDRNLRQAVRAYFADRAAWWTWTRDTLAGALTAGDKRVRSVGTIELATLDGTQLSEFTAEIPAHVSAPVTHLDPDDALTAFEYMT